MDSESESYDRKKRLTLDEPATRTGFAKSYRSKLKLETLKNQSPVGTLAKIAYLFGVDENRNFFAQVSVTSLRGFER